MTDQTPTSDPTEAARGDVEVVEPTPLERAYARNVAEAKATIPHLYLETEAEVGAAGVGTELVVRACALALREFPRVNGAYRDGRFELYSRINIGVAVAAQRTLLFPTIADADEKDAPAIAEELEELARRAREGTITQPDLSGGTFTIADPGSHGVVRGGPAVVHRGQAAIMTVGAPREQAVERDGRLATTHRISLVLACDSRILQGPDAAEFLDRVRALLEEPAA